MLDKFKDVIEKTFGRKVFLKIKLLKNLFKSYDNKYYSQFGEDVILRVLIGDQPKKGFYVDVGSYHPRHLSNTFYFYKKGWSGINIDPNPNAINLFNFLRKRDKNVNFAISANGGEASFHSWDSVYDTISETEADEMRRRIGPEKEVYKIKTERLENILDKYLPAGQNIDFLNVDAEGCDLDVLKSNNWQKYRPRFIVVEEHNTNVDEIVNSEKVKLLDSVGYKLVSWTLLSLFFARKN